MVDVITQTNEKIFGGAANAIGNINWLHFGGWVIFIILAVGAGLFAFIYYRDKKVFTKLITAFDIVGIYFTPAFNDVAKVVKLGSGGFEILYLKKLKTWKLAYGGKIGTNRYYFFIMPDGYWYNGMLSANMHSIDKNGGLIPIVTTNPNMRANYTALEKQIDSLHKDKKGFMEQYGQWVFGITYIAVMGIFFWLVAREVGPVLNNMGAIADRQGLILDKLAQFAGNLNCQAPGAAQTGLVAVG